jgi:hypothetical protein
MFVNQLHPDLMPCLVYHLIRCGWRKDPTKRLVKQRQVVGSAFADLVAYVPLTDPDEPIVAPAPATSRSHGRCGRKSTRSTRRGRLMPLPIGSKAVPGKFDATIHAFGTISDLDTPDMVEYTIEGFGPNAVLNTAAIQGDQGPPGEQRPAGQAPVPHPGLHR